MDTLFTVTTAALCEIDIVDLRIKSVRIPGGTIFVYYQLLERENVKKFMVFAAKRDNIVFGWK